MNVLVIFPRAGAIVVAVILVAISAATIGVINNNDGLVRTRDYDGSDSLTDEGILLQILIRFTQAAAIWLIVLNIFIMIAEIISIILQHVVIVNLKPTLRLIFSILEMIFSGVVIMCYLFSGIACTIYAANWGKPPDVCQTVDNISDDDQDDLCDSIPLSVTNGLEAAFCFLQIGVVATTVCVTLLGLARRSHDRRPEKA